MAASFPESPTRTAVLAMADAEIARRRAVVPPNGGRGTVPTRPRPASSPAQGPVTAAQVHAAAQLFMAQASGRGTREVIRAGQRDMGMSSHDQDGVWGPRTVARAVYLLGSAGEQAMPARSPRAHAARQAAIYVATGGHDPARIRQFQAALGVPQSGTIDQPTAAVMQQELAAT